MEKKNNTIDMFKDIEDKKNCEIISIVKETIKKHAESCPLKNFIPVNVDSLTKDFKRFCKEHNVIPLNSCLFTKEFGVARKFIIVYDETKNDYNVAYESASIYYSSKRLMSTVSSRVVLKEIYRVYVVNGISPNYSIRHRKEQFNYICNLSEAKYTMFRNKKDKYLCVCGTKIKNFGKNPLFDNFLIDFVYYEVNLKNLELSDVKKQTTYFNFNKHNELGELLFSTDNKEECVSFIKDLITEKYVDKINSINII